MNESLLLYDRMQWKLAEFFLSIGAEEVNGKVKMNWNIVPRATGRAIIEQRADRKDPNKKCHPASLICESAEVAQKMTENMEKDAGCVIDIEEAEKAASEDVVAQREEALAKQLSEMKRRKKRLVDPLQFEMSIQAEDLSGYVPAFGWEMAPPSDGQKKTLEKLGILPDAIENAGKASKILDRLDKRRREGLTTPKQIRFLESRGFQHVGTWQFETAKNMIDRIAGNGWRVPSGIIPAEYRG